MTIYQTFCMFGFPTLFTACILGIYHMIKAHFKEQDKKAEAVQLGIQALLRDRLYEQYNHYSEKGYAPIYVQENWCNMYAQYHALGANGVMNDLDTKFRKLPTPEEFKTTQK